MKKLILFIISIFICLQLNAQTYEYRTTGFTINEFNDYYQSWSGWSEIKPSNMKMIINFSSGLVTIYSPKTQVYKIVENKGNYCDSDGDYNMVYRFYDQDGDYGTMTLLIRTSGRSEIYI